MDESADDIVIDEYVEMTEAEWCRVAEVLARRPGGRQIVSAIVELRYFPTMRREVE